MGIFRRARNEPPIIVPRQISDEPFRSLKDSAALLKELNYRPVNQVVHHQLVVPVQNERLMYDLTITEEPYAGAVYLGAQIEPNVIINERFAKDLLIENSQLNHAKLAIIPNEGTNNFNILATNEIRTAFLTKGQFVDEIRAFDAAVTYSHQQVKALKAKHNPIILDESTIP